MMDDVDLFLKLLFKHRWDWHWLYLKARVHGLPYCSTVDGWYTNLHCRACRGLLDERKVLDDADRIELSRLYEIPNRDLVLEVPGQDTAPLGPAA